ncbi:MAG: hypothetical protein ACTTH7_05940 [Treponema sp.]
MELLTDEECPACGSRCTPSYGLYRCGHCGYCFSIDQNGRKKIRSTPLRDSLLTYTGIIIWVLFIAAIGTKDGLLSVLTCIGFIINSIMVSVNDILNWKRYHYYTGRHIQKFHHDRIGFFINIAMLYTFPLFFIGIVLYFIIWD